MRIIPVIAPTTDQEVNEGLVALLKHADSVGAKIDVTGFAHAWLSTYTRVIVATDDDGKTLGFGIMAFGTQYHAPEEPTASVLMAVGPARKELLRYMKDCALMLGAKRLIYEAEDGDDLGGEPSRITQLALV